MATWYDVQSFARSRYKLAEDNASDFKVVFEYEGGQLRAVVVSRVEALGQSWCDFASAICKKSDLPTEEALKRNFKLAVGSIGIDHDIYVARYTVPLRTFSAKEDLELGLHIVASTAHSLEVEYRKR